MGVHSFFAKDWDKKNIKHWLSRKSRQQYFGSKIMRWNEKSNEYIVIAYVAHPRDDEKTLMGETDF